MKNRTASRTFADKIPTPKRSSALQPASRPGLATAMLFDVPETPIKKAVGLPPAPRAASPVKEVTEKKQTSIYSKLGWDDDDDLDELM